MHLSEHMETLWISFKHTHMLLDGVVKKRKANGDLTDTEQEDKAGEPSCLCVSSFCLIFAHFEFLFFFVVFWTASENDSHLFFNVSVIRMNSPSYFKAFTYFS